MAATLTKLHHRQHVTCSMERRQACATSQRALTASSDGVVSLKHVGDACVPLRAVMIDNLNRCCLTLARR